MKNNKRIPLSAYLCECETKGLGGCTPLLVTSAAVAGLRSVGLRSVRGGGAKEDSLAAYSGYIGG